MTAEYTKLISELAALTETIKAMTERKKAIEAVLLRLHRTKIVCVLRSQIFRQIVQ